MFEAGTNEGGMSAGKLAASADHNMNSQGTEGKAQHFPFPSFPPFPFMPRDLPSHPLSINLTGALGAAEESEDSATSSPNSGESEKEDKKEEEDLAFAQLPPVLIRSWQSLLWDSLGGPANNMLLNSTMMHRLPSPANHSPAGTTMITQ